jgi:hypothetical protein
MFVEKVSKEAAGKWKILRSLTFLLQDRKWTIRDHLRRK